jgi:hypothetical protein
MKLARIITPLRSVQVRVTLAGDLNACLECYARYYEHIHGEPVDSRVLIQEILRAFLNADREFQSWSRSGAGDQTAASPPRLPRDWLERAPEQGVADAESDLAELAVNGVASG